MTTVPVMELELSLPPDEPALEVPEEELDPLPEPVPAAGPELALEPPPDGCDPDAEGAGG
ncbi:MAG TPA: hypothetical protein VJS37_11370 [Terriglobales bacterium]|nr:hypothetical protein [Terriglobales bacterium]